jgi:hypothetical protein
MERQKVSWIERLNLVKGANYPQTGIKIFKTVTQKSQKYFVQTNVKLF